MSDGLNVARATRILEIMNDFRNLQHYLVQLPITPTAEEYYLDGFSVLRGCIQEAQAILDAPFYAPAGATAGNSEQEKQQLKVIIVDAAVRRFRCQRAYLRSHVAMRWMNSRNHILRGQPPNATHFHALQQIDNTMRTELYAITDAYVESSLRSQDAAQHKWLSEDPSLAHIQQILSSQ